MTISISQRPGGEASYNAECVRFVLANLRDWEVDSIVDFGSHAKGEAIEGSDYDLAICLHPDRLFLPDFIQDDYKSTTHGRRRFI